MNFNSGDNLVQKCTAVLTCENNPEIELNKTRKLCNRIAQKGIFVIQNNISSLESSSKFIMLYLFQDVY